MIISVKHTAPDNIPLIVLYDNGREDYVTEYPSGTEVDRAIQEFIQAGGTIEDYVQPLSEAKAEKQATIESNYAIAEALPVTLGGFDFTADSEAQGETLAVISRVDHGDTLPPGWTWPDSDGVERATDAQGMVSLFKAISNKHWADRHNKAILMGLVLAATTIAEVEAIEDW